MVLGIEPVEAELARIGLLLQHDRELPSATALIAGEPIVGSWWGHALGHRIYDVLVHFEERTGQLSAKVVDGKITYVHERLWPAFFSLVLEAERAHGTELSALAGALWEAIARQGTLRADEAAVRLLGSSKELTRAGREIEQRLLVRATSLHSTSGAHVKLYQTWRCWAAEHGLASDSKGLPEARAELERAVEALCRGTTRRPKVPLLGGPD